jgi:aspartate/methionine/tyrosine aminotransferase
LYCDIVGILQLREVICRYHKEVDGLQFSAENVLVGPGTKELIFLLLSIVCGG